MVKKTHKLTVHPDYNFKLIGISSHEHDYRLSWAINSTLHLQFSKTRELEILHKKFAEKQTFSVYVYEDENTQIRYHLISNRCDNGFLIEELKNIDFILQIFGEISESFIKQWIEKLNKIDVITTAFAIDPGSLKSRDKLIY